MVNKAVLIGRLGKDPEIRNTQTDQPVANFSIATSESWKDKDGKKQERTEWHNIVVWGQLATICAQYIRKGSLVYVEGRLQTRSYEAKDGAKRYTTEVVATTVQFLDRKSDGAGTQGETAPEFEPGIFG